MTPVQLQQYATTFAQQNNVPPELFLAQIGQESGWNIYAQNGDATGIAQFMPSTAAGLGVDLGTSDQQVLSQLQGAAIYDAQLYSQSGSWTDVMRKYGTTANGNGAQVAALASAIDANRPESVLGMIGSGFSRLNPATPYMDTAKKISAEGFGVWVQEHIGNFTLIAFGAVLAVAALIFSQRDNIKVAVSSASKIAEKGAVGAFLA